MRKVLVLCLALGLCGGVNVASADEADCSSGNCIETKTSQGLTLTIMRVTDRAAGYGLVFTCVHNPLIVGRWYIRYRDYEDAFARRGLRETTLSLMASYGLERKLVYASARVVDGDVIADEADAIIAEMIDNWRKVDGFRIFDRSGGANLHREFGRELAGVRQRCAGY